MKTIVIVMLRRALGVWLAFTALLFILGATCPASAQTLWTEHSAYQTWTGYNNDFYTTGENGSYIFSAVQKGSTSTGFWEEAEEIELAEDAYYWAKHNGNYGANLYKYRDEIDNLCTGFVDNMPSRFVGPDGKYDWSGDNFNDDLDWAVMAFVRAYRITGNSTWLSAAEVNFNTVWNRAQAPGGQGDGLSGLIQSQPHGTNWTPNLDSPVNFTFVIAGNLLYEETGNATYRNYANNVYTWAMANLYRTTVDDGAGPGVCVGHTDLVCAKVYDGTNGHSDYTYDYGIAIQAAVLEHDFTRAQYMANWLMYNSNNPNFPYAGTYTLKGVPYNILPNYKQGGVNDAGYNGIALRGIGLGLSRGALNTTTLVWAQANLQAAWELKNSTNVMSNDWNNQTSPLPTTPSSGLYSWDCSPAVAGMFDIPAPNQYWKYR